MPDYDVTLVHRKSGRVVRERTRADDADDARLKATRSGWLTGSIEPAPPDTDEPTPPDADESAGRVFTDDEWTRLYQTIRRGVIVGTLIYTAIVVAAGLLVWALVVMVAEAS